MGKTVSMKISNEEREARRKKRKNMMAEALKNTQQMQDDIKDLEISEELKQILSISGIENDDVIQGIKSTLAHDLEPVITKRIKAEIAFMLKT